MSQSRDPKAEAEGKPFGAYTVFERIGVGGMATVHRAKERGIAGFERTVALKRLLPHLAEDEDFVAAFVREARFASLLTHGNICQIFELGRVGDDYFIAMEHIEGCDLRRVLKQARRAAGPPPLGFTLFVLSELCDALDYAHMRTDDDGRPLGLVHRDISPSNLLVSKSGHLKVIDFGIAKATTDQHATRTGAIKGKLAYMAPEALTGKGLDARSDLFSVGVVAYELLTARPLFADKNDFKVIQNIQGWTPPLPSSRNKEIPPALDEVVMRALEKSSIARWQSAREMLESLHTVSRKHGLHPTSQDVTEWIDFAFALPVPDRPNPAYRASDSSVSAVSFPTAPSVEPISRVARENATIESFLRPNTPGSQLLDLDAPDADRPLELDLPGQSLVDLPGAGDDSLHPLPEDRSTVAVGGPPALEEIPDLGVEEPDGMTVESESPFAHRRAELPPSMRQAQQVAAPPGSASGVERALKSLGGDAAGASNPARQTFVTFRAPAKARPEPEDEAGKPLVEVDFAKLDPGPPAPEAAPRITSRTPVAVIAGGDAGEEEDEERAARRARRDLSAADEGGIGTRRLVVLSIAAAVAVVIAVVIHLAF
jgi:eukaryotic-like serine/threonine-protein kinase